jgi:HAD superfamily hydrolase (TIGR01509 family)
MIKAILLDLDNTLIVNPDDTFAKAYLGVAEPFFSQHLGIATPRELLLGIVQTLSQPRSGEISNIQHIYNQFQHYTHAPLAHIQATLEAFFQEIYPQLATLVAPIPYAHECLTALQDDGYAVVIATNPLYMKTAIIQRMVWGQLPLENYALVTHAENMHFAKPDPAYYAEIVARVGIEPDEALIIGDNPINDIQAAQAVGLNTFHVTDTRSRQPLFHQLQNPAFLPSFTPPPLAPQMVLHELRGNIGALNGLLEGVTHDMWHLRPDPNEWSILQIICHLCISETTTQRARLQNILSQDNPFVIDPQAPGPNMPICHDDLQAVTQNFIHERQATIALLRALSEADWQRPARHSIFGLTTLLEMAHFTAQHDRIHINQLCQTIGRCQEYSF